MRKLFFTFFVLPFVTSAVSAQTSVGSKMIGGTINFYSLTEEQGSGNENYKVSGFEFVPSFGYFISNNLALGLNLGYTNLTEDDQGFETKYSELSIAPFARIYKFTSNEKFAFFAEGSLEFGSGKVKPEGIEESKSSSFTFAVSPGFAYFFNEKWVIDFQLQGISYRKEDPDKDADNDASSTFIFGASSFNPSLGFRFFF